MRCGGADGNVSVHRNLVSTWHNSGGEVSQKFYRDIEKPPINFLMLY
jgi:hypothetical protein